MKVAQLCQTLCDPMDYTVYGILHARILEWVAFPFSRGLPDPEIEPGSPALQVDSLPTELSGKPTSTYVMYQFSMCFWVEAFYSLGLVPLAFLTSPSWKKQESSRKTSTSALLTMPKPLTLWITTNCGKFLNRSEYQTTWSASWETCMQVKKQQNWTWNNRLVSNRKRSALRLYSVTLLI